MKPGFDIAYIALGSNIGDREQHLADARRRIAEIPGLTVLRESTVEETAPIGPVEQSEFLNQMLAVSTDLDPSQLLEKLQHIEHMGGRERGMRWGPRTIDLDIVLYENTTWDEPDLNVPHSELQNRDFWIREIAEIREPNAKKNQ